MIRPFSKKRAKQNSGSYKEAKQVAWERCEGRCEAYRYGLTSRCSGELEPDHIVPRGRGGILDDPNNIQWLCHAHHTMKTHVMVKGASIIGMNGISALEKERYEWEYKAIAQNPELTIGDLERLWKRHQAIYCKSIDAEMRYMLGGSKPKERYGKNS